MVGRPDSELKALTDRFVCVRLVQMGGVDLGIYQFDPFLAWAVFFMNGDKTIYGRFGTASPQSNRNKLDSNNNHTLSGLKAALKKALEVHDQYVADRGALSKRLAQSSPATTVARQIAWLRNLRQVAPFGRKTKHRFEVAKFLVDRRR